MTRILVAEDSPVNMALLADILEIHGHEVLEARNGKEAVEVAKAQMPDLILLDMMMPVMDGFEAAQRLKGDDLTKKIPIVALTALAMDGDERRALDAGCDAYVSKPIDTRALPVLLDQILGRGPGGLPKEVLDAMQKDLLEGLDAIVGAMEVLGRRANDHDAVKRVRYWAHRLRGGALTLELEDLALELGAIEDAARAADEAGRMDEATFRDVRDRLVQVYAMQSKLRRLGGS